MESSRLRSGNRHSGATLGKVIVTVAALTFYSGAGVLLANDFRIVPNAFTLPAPTALKDSAAAAATVTAYHRALAAGDSAAALAILAPDATILESGGMETREEYRSHHLPSDIAFARAVRSVDGPVRVKVQGDVAWAVSTNVVQGQFRGRPVNSVGAELMVLNRISGEWKIVAIHWSSRARRP